MVREEDSHPIGHGFESRRMDGWKLIASYYIKEKFENKGSQMGNTKKIFKKKISYLVFLFFIYFT